MGLDFSVCFLTGWWRGLFSKSCKYSSLDLILGPFKLRFFHFLMSEVTQDCRRQITLNSLLYESLHVLVAANFAFWEQMRGEVFFNPRFF